MSNEAYDKLCKKHSLTGEAKVDFKNFFEKEIIRVFNRKSIEVGKEKEIKKIATTTKSKTNSDGQCVGKKADGKPCTFKAKPDSDYCGRHNPDKSTSKSTDKSTSKSTDKSASKPRVKKENARDCHAIIAVTGKKCIQPATIKPDGSDFYYCKRHSEKWLSFEPPVENDLNASEEESQEAEKEENQEAEEEEAEEEAVEEEATESATEE